MKKLLLIRHAKAVHDTSYSDFERPLKHSGIRDATAIAERMKSESIIPQLLITSPSVRTQATADIFSEHLSISKPTQNEDIYEAGQQDLLHIINAFEDKYDFIGLIGHNPGISQILNYFTGEFHEVSPGTAGLISFEVDDWKLISQNTGTLTWFSSPKDN
ncbi:MAG: histidine phosphatase family protein [Mucilaginibacter sp.]|nr:histidine phosphatase family protein [Mucilaginibacter sp.]